MQVSSLTGYRPNTDLAALSSSPATAAGTSLASLLRAPANGSAAGSLLPPGGATPPSSVNWVAAGKVAPVKNQLRCGDCWCAEGVREGRSCGGKGMRACGPVHACTHDAQPARRRKHMQVVRCNCCDRVHGGDREQQDCNFS